jgi:hypothetical protein
MPQTVQAAEPFDPTFYGRSRIRVFEGKRELGMKKMTSVAAMGLIIASTALASALAYDESRDFMGMKFGSSCEETKAQILKRIVERTVIAYRDRFMCTPSEPKLTFSDRIGTVDLDIVVHIKDDQLGLFF